MGRFFRLIDNGKLFGPGDLPTNMEKFTAAANSATMIDRYVDNGIGVGGCLGSFTRIYIKYILSNGVF